MTKSDKKSVIIQKPFRCPVDLDERLNRAKGAIMFKTGQSISHNQFMIELLELGLQALQDRPDSNNLTASASAENVSLS